MACSAPSSTQDPHSLPTRPHAAPTRVAGALPAGCPVLARGVGVGTVLWLQRRLWLLFFRQLLRPEGQSMDPEDGCRAAEEGGVGAARLMPALCASRGCRGFWGMGLACMQLVNGGRTPAGGLTNQRICAATAHATCFLSRPSRIPSFCSPDAARFNKHIWHPPPSSATLTYVFDALADGAGGVQGMRVLRPAVRTDRVEHDGVAAFGPHCNVALHVSAT